ncbi:hypothetical protein GCK32_020997, partial [Trichostrongylus colubriformis]
MPSGSRSPSNDGDVPSPKSSRSSGASVPSEAPSPKSDNGLREDAREKSRDPSPKSDDGRQARSLRRSRTKVRSQRNQNTSIRLSQKTCRIFP